jgi:hypothetical protein
MLYYLEKIFENLFEIAIIILVFCFGIFIFSLCLILKIQDLLPYRTYKMPYVREN